MYIYIYTCIHISRAGWSGPFRPKSLGQVYFLRGWAFGEHFPLEVKSGGQNSQKRVDFSVAGRENDDFSGSACRFASRFAARRWFYVKN